MKLASLPTLMNRPTSELPFPRTTYFRCVGCPFRISTRSFTAGLPEPDYWIWTGLLLEGVLALSAGPERDPDSDHDGGKGYVPVGAVSTSYSELVAAAEGNNNCVPICPVQAKYNAVKTLAKRPQYGGLTSSPNRSPPEW